MDDEIERYDNLIHRLKGIIDSVRYYDEFLRKDDINNSCHNFRSTLDSAIQGSPIYHIPPERRGTARELHEESNFDWNEKERYLRFCDSEKLNDFLNPEILEGYVRTEFKKLDKEPAYSH